MYKKGYNTKSFLPYIRDWFLSKREHFTSFSTADSRIEGWFKAELLVLFNKLAQEGRLKYEREANITSPKDGKRKQVDFRFKIDGEDHRCELKALCISQAAGTPRNLHFYFRDDHMSLIKDFKKLDELPYKNKWLLTFIYPSPKESEWGKVVGSLPSTLKHWNAITDPRDFPEFVFISL
jgi:hypothetical protein